MSNVANRWRANAVAAALLAACCGGVQAVSVNPGGLGQVLLFPYFSARTVGGSPNNTVFSLTNTDGTKAKALRVSIREGKAGAVVLDFNLFLAPSQTWAAAVSPSGSGGGQIATNSLACTTPHFPVAPVSFRNFIYVGDGMGDGLDRTLEGHIEVIEMATYASGSQTFAAVTPVNGVATCATTDAAAAADAQAPTGKVMGYAEVVNVLAGTTHAAVPTALDAFSATPLYFSTASFQPNLGDVNPARADVRFGASLISASGFPRAVDAVSAVLMQNLMYDELADESAFGMATDWVVTFPTKSYYYASGAPVALFQRSITPGGACDDFSFALNALPQGAANAALCFATDVITFTPNNVLGSANVLNVARQGAGGFAGLQPVPSAVPGTFHSLTASSATTYALPGSATSGAVTFNGLPAIRFAARRALQAPPAPTAVNASAGNANATVTFTAPANDGGSAITGYAVTSSPAGGADTNAGSTSASHLVTGLANGTAYTFTVKASNAIGIGPASAASNSVTPKFTTTASLSASPVNFSYDGNTASFTATVIGTAPTGSVAFTDNGVSFNCDAVSLSSGSVNARRAVCNTSNLAVGGHSITATYGGNAFNAASASSALPYAVKTPTAPNPPVIGGVVPGNQSAAVSFAPPEDDGGRPITGYTVMAKPGGGLVSNGASLVANPLAVRLDSTSVRIGATVSTVPGGPVDSNAGSLATSHMVVGLVNGVAYTFEVIATNDLGSSAPSPPSDTVKPAPDTPLLDVDVSVTATRYDALTDGLLVIRYLFGLTGNALIAGAAGPTATRIDATAIKTYLDAIRPFLDVDGNGATDALTDGLLIIRYLFGLRGPALIAGAVHPLGTRKTAPEIEGYLLTLMP
jgi:hypothetical protein